jgi:hypothetical protein
MLLFGSVLISATSAAGMIELSTVPVLGDLAAVAFALSAFVAICAAEARG